MHRDPWRGVLVGAALAVLVAVPGGVRAQTAPGSGAVAKPDGLVLSLPFEAGERVEVLSAYGPSMGSGLHDGTDRTCCANDYYGLDLILPDWPSAGLGRPVLAAADGVIAKAGWGTEGWANYGQRVYIRHSFEDGHTYTSIYAHLDSITVQEGDPVVRGQAIGTLGGSCQGALSCGSFSTPHVHFALHRDSSLGGSGTGGSYGGNAVVPEPIDGHTFLARGQILVSANNGQPAAPCDVIEASAPKILDERGSCFRRLGTPQYWTEASVGYDDTSLYTFTVDNGVDNHGVWQLHFATAGEYDVEVYIPPQHGLSRQAPYTVRASAVEQTVVRDQTAVVGGWLSLGRFAFEAGGDQWLRLVDDTGEPYDGVRTLSFDAARITHHDPGSGCDCQGDASESEPCGTRCGTRSRTCDGCSWGAWGACGGEGECSAAGVEQEVCASGEARTRTCSAACSWGAWSMCGEVLDEAPDDTSLADTSAADTADPGTLPDGATLPAGDTQTSSADTVAPSDAADADSDGTGMLADAGCACASLRAAGSPRRGALPLGALVLMLGAWLAARRRQGGGVRERR